MYSSSDRWVPLRVRHRPQTVGGPRMTSFGTDTGPSSPESTTCKLAEILAHDTRPPRLVRADLGELPGFGGWRPIRVLLLLVLLLPLDLVQLHLLLAVGLEASLGAGSGGRSGGELGVGKEPVGDVLDSPRSCDVASER